MKGAPIEVLRGGIVQALYQLRGEGKSIRAIARTLGIFRNTVGLGRRIFGYLQTCILPKLLEPNNSQRLLFCDSSSYP